MASVFLSYAREDIGKARPVASALEKAGHKVWWDPHMRGGAEFSRVIEEALKAADAVVVLWSRSSVESPWVRDEAAAGRDRGLLVPVSLDGTEPPLGFRQFHTIDLSRWSGRGRVPRLAEIGSAIEGVVNRDDQPVTAAPPPAGKSSGRWPYWPAAAVLALAGLALALFLWRPWQGPSAPSVAVVAAEPGTGSKALARDLFVQLGRLQATNADALHLVDDQAGGAEFRLEVSAPGQAPRPGASLALVDGKDRTLLWSRSFEQPSGSAADLREQLAYSAASVLGCAAEAGAVRLSDESRKAYLNGCAEYAEGGGPAVIGMFEKVARAEPHFRAAWAKLLLAESSHAVSTLLTTGDDAAIRRSLRGHIAQARKHHGTFAELLIVEQELLPLNAFAERIRLAEAAVELHPQNPNALFARGDELMSVGRVSDAIADVNRAHLLDPLSPARRDQNINFLISAGRTAAAAKALSDAERLSPGTDSLAGLRLRFHAWLGDPAPAMQLYRATGSSSPVTEAWIAARVDPSQASRERAESEARAMFARSGDLTFYAQVMAGLGRPDAVYDAIARSAKPLPLDNTYVYFTPWMRPFRADPRFIRVAAGLGLTDYWTKSGKWPDFCFEPGLPYDCKAEAAKLAK